MKPARVLFIISNRMSFVLKIQKHNDGRRKVNNCYRDCNSASLQMSTQ